MSATPATLRFNISHSNKTNKRAVPKFPQIFPHQHSLDFPYQDSNNTQYQRRLPNLTSRFHSIFELWPGRGMRARIQAATCRQPNDGPLRTAIGFCTSSYRKKPPDRFFRRAFSSSSFPRKAFPEDRAHGSINCNRDGTNCSLSHGSTTASRWKNNTSIPSKQRNLSSGHIPNTQLRYCEISMPPARPLRPPPARPPLPA